MNYEGFIEEVSNLNSESDYDLWHQVFVFATDSENQYHGMPVFDVLKKKITSLALAEKATVSLRVVKDLLLKPLESTDSYVYQLDSVFDCFDQYQLEELSGIFKPNFVSDILNSSSFSFENKALLLLRMSTISVLSQWSKASFKIDFFKRLKNEFPLVWIDVLVYSNQFDGFEKEIKQVLRSRISDFDLELIKERLDEWKVKLDKSSLSNLKSILSHETKKSINGDMFFSSQKTDSFFRKNVFFQVSPV